MLGVVSTQLITNLYSGCGSFSNGVREVITNVLESQLKVKQLTLFYFFL